MIRKRLQPLANFEFTQLFDLLGLLWTLQRFFSTIRAVDCGPFGGLVAARLRQPIMLGELAAGLFVGYAATSLCPSRALDCTTLRILSEIGICALLFDVGLKIHPSKIRAIGAEALLVALAGVAFQRKGL